MLNNKTNLFSVEVIPFAEVKKDIIAEKYLSWLNDREVTKLIASPILEKENDLSIIDESYQRFTSENCQGFFIRDKKSSEFIGTAKLDKIDLYHNSAELGIMIGEKSFWGKGISKQVFEILMQYAFCNIGVNRLWGGTNYNNFAMRKTFTNLGFKQEGILRMANIIDGKYSDNYIYSILKEEYLQGHECKK